MLDKFYKGLGKLISTCGFIVLGVIVRGYVLSWLWLWFIVPVFPVRSLSILQAIGLSYAATAFFPARKESQRTFSQIIAEVIGGSLFTLLFGWVLHLVMVW